MSAAGPGAAPAGAARRTLIMGVVNVTPDSFSDGGRFERVDAAIAQGLRLVAQGADWIDVGGESTRPGAVRVDPAVELARVLPVVRELAAAGVAVSIDTLNASTAAACATRCLPSSWRRPPAASWARHTSSEPPSPRS